MQQSDVRPRPNVDPESIAAYILTSGTTGLMEKNNFSKELNNIYMFKVNLKLQCYHIQILCHQ